MAYNLIDERWIPVLRKSGKVEMIAPAEVADQDDPPLRIASPRPDFDGALLEFLIGLLQTAAAPATERVWTRAFETPPAVAALKKQLDVVRDAFFLDGDGPRFMQECGLGGDNSKHKPIGYLLIDRGGEINIGDGPSLFTKEGQVPALSNAATATALYLSQSHAPSGGGGGGGHFTSIRGGSALSVLILGEDLWRTVWLNVIPEAAFSPNANATTTDAKTFPWLGPIVGGNKKTGLPTMGAHLHPAHAYWALPRRVLLTEAAAIGLCAVYATENSAVWTGLLTATAGMRYEGLVHPLAAFRRKSEGEPWLPFMTSAQGFCYRDWPVVVQSTTHNRPPVVVSYFASSGRGDLVSQARLVTFGYAMDSMKPLRWCRAETPLIIVRAELISAFASEVEQLVAVSKEVSETLSYQVRSAWSDRPKDLTVFDLVNPAFWSRTESGFFAAVHLVKGAIERDDSSGLIAAKEAWLAELHASALSLFDSFVETPADLATPDLWRAVVARHELDKFTRHTSNKLRRLLGLSFDDATQAKRNRKPPQTKKENNP